MKIINAVEAFGAEVTKSIARCFQNEKYENLIVYGLEWPEDEDAHLFEIIQLAKSGKPVLVLSMESVNSCYLDKSGLLLAAISFSNVAFLSMPGRLAIADDILNTPVLWNELAVQAALKGWNGYNLSHGSGLSDLAQMWHSEWRVFSSDSAMRDRFQPGWRETAVKLFGDLPDEELRVASEALKEQTVEGEALAPATYDAICVDVEGTLLNEEGEIRIEVVEMVKAEAEKQQLPVVMWTGGDLKKIAQQLQGYRRRRFGDDMEYQPSLLPDYWPLVSKYALKGSTVTLCVDDMNRDEFMKSYDITSLDYKQV